MLYLCQFDGRSDRKWLCNQTESSPADARLQFEKGNLSIPTRSQIVLCSQKSIPATRWLTEAEHQSQLGMANYRTARAIGLGNIVDPLEKFPWRNVLDREAIQGQSVY